MTKAEIVNTIKRLTIDEQIRWMEALGGELTVAARNFYEVGTENAAGKPLRGFNEIQHRIYGRIRDLRDGHDWTLESFVVMLREYSKIYAIERDVLWAIKASMPKLNQ